LARSTDCELPALRVEQVDEASLDLYTRTMAEAWGIDPGPLALANTLALASPRHALFLAFIDGAPAATAGTVMFERSVYLLGGVTLPRARRRGAYRALVAARLEHARDRGIALATCHARASTSAPILEALGFERVCRWDVFRG
jgi:GNAT superfamily N-acetyltransferase